MELKTTIIGVLRGISIPKSESNSSTLVIISYKFQSTNNKKIQVKSIKQ